MRKIIIALLSVSAYAAGQTTTDTITFMQYNLLNYRNITTYCTASNNNPTSKEGYMRTIVSHVMPDLIAVNELAGDGGTAANRLLTNALNKDGRNYYKQCNYAANSSLCNMLYYNKNKFVLAKQDKIERSANNSFLVRLIDVYTLYYLDEEMLEAGDTTYMTVYVAHLKAGSTSSDKAERKEMTDAVMKYHEENYSTSNYIIAGDFNIKTSSEPSYKTLLEASNASVRFYDPIARSASWNNNSLYSSVHTQSTRTSGGCASTGGMDDRFDFVLCGKEILDNTRGIHYVSGSYTAVGNEAKHFNKSIIEGTNNSVPADVLSALYNMSDHLPVSIKMAVTRTLSSVSESRIDNFLIVTNPVNNIMHWKMQLPQNGKLQVRNIQGQLIHDEFVSQTNQWIQTDVSHWAKGTYYVSFLANNGDIVRRKIVKM